MNMHTDASKQTCHKNLEERLNKLANEKKKERNDEQTGRGKEDKETKLSSKRKNGGTNGRWKEGPDRAGV